MAEFWPENQSESSCAKIVKSSSNAQMPVAGIPSGAADPPTILSSSSSKSMLAIPPEASPLIARELAGEMLAHFRLDDYVAVGGMGAVFRATDMRLERSVALKILPPDQAKDAEIVQRFQQEACAAARLDHENIARVFFIGEDRGLHFIAFEFVEGVNVREMIAQCGPLPAHEVVNYALQIAGALVHANSRGVVHRDIKPSNIIITMAGRAKLVDMGLARHFERRHDGGLTQSNITLGTFDYIAPEQARDPRSADVRSDIYSLGCTLFHMLTGQPPYPEGTLLQKLLKHQEESPPDPRELNPHVPAFLAAVVRRMMAKDPMRRQQSPHDLLSEFMEIAADMGLRSTSPEGLIWVAERRTASMSKVTAAVWLTAAAVLIAAVWRLYSISSDKPVRITEHAKSESVAGDVPEWRPGVNSQSTSDPDIPRRSHAAESADPPGSRPDNSRGVSGTRVEPAPLEDAADDADVIAVGPEQDLRSILAQAPSGSVIELSGEHRPQLMHKVDDTAGIRIEGKRLTIKAAPGARPRLILAYDPQAFGVADWNLLTVVNSQLELEGIHFEIQAADMPRSSMAMIACQSSQVTLRRCSFFQTSSLPAAETARREEGPSIWVGHLESGMGMDNRLSPGRITALECFFGGGDGAFNIAAASRTELRDCVLFPYRSTFLIRSVGASPHSEADLRLSNVSLFGGGNPIFDLSYARAVVTSQAVVYSHDPSKQGVLARLDADSRLDWKGKRNLYHGLRQYLVQRSESGQVPLAGRLSDWLELSREVDEQDSVETETSPWLITLAEAASRSANDFVDAFRMVRRADDSNGRSLGARFVFPWGALYSAEPIDATAQQVKQFARIGSGASQSGDAARGYPGADSRGDRPAKSEVAVAARPPTESSGTPGGKLNVQKIISTMPTSENSPPSQDSSTAASRPAPDAATSGTTQRDTLVVDPQHPGAIATLAAACARAEDGGVIEIRYSGRLREGPVELGDRHLTIRAAAGYRPIVDFTVSQFELRGREPRLFDVRRGSLTLKDLDLHLIADPAISMETWTAIASRGADVQIDNCTVTVESGAGATSSVVRFLSSDVDDPMASPTGDTTPARPQFQLRNSLAVGMSHLARIQPSVRVRMEIENCAIDVQENVLAVTGGMDRAILGAVNEVEIRHATLRTRRGLVSYEANESRAWLPRLEITCADNLFISDGEGPWIRFRSPRSADELRGLLRWKGMNNSYDGVAGIWQIESMTTGDSELLYWDEWTRSPARDEIKADRGRIEFAASPGDVSPWLRTRFHFKPVSSAVASEMASDGGSRGADLNLIPPPPQEREPTSR